MFREQFKVSSPLGPSASFIGSKPWNESKESLAHFTASQIRRIERGCLAHLWHAGFHLPMVLVLFFTLCWSHSLYECTHDMQKTAVTTPFGLFEFPRMCFGLRKARQTFQRHIDNFLWGLPVFPFVDDILVASETREQHRRDLEDVFRRLNDHGLQLNVSKCIFGQQTLEFLLHCNHRQY